MPLDPKAVAFFYEHANTSFTLGVESEAEGRMRGAIDSARAEAKARKRGYTFVWSDDWEVGSHKDEYGPDSAYADGEPDRCEHCDILDKNGNMIGSLSCIDDASPEYRRVIEAELASEHADLGPRPVMPSHAGIPDARYSVAVEFSGAQGKARGLKPGQSWVARFCGEFIASHATRREAVQACAARSDETARGLHKAHEERLRQITALHVPDDYPVRPLADDESAEDRVTCGTCGRSWDDAVVTGMTPAPSARCPFEAFHAATAAR